MQETAIHSTGTFHSSIKHGGFISYVKLLPPPPFSLKSISSLFLNFLNPSNSKKIVMKKLINFGFSKYPKA